MTRAQSAPQAALGTSVLVAAGAVAVWAFARVSGTVLLPSLLGPVVAFIGLLVAWAVVQGWRHAADVRRLEAAGDLQRQRARAWLAHRFERGDAPPLDAASRAALAELCEVTTGEAGEAFRVLYVERGFLQQDVTLVRARDRLTRLAALGRLARVRHEASLRVLPLVVAEGDATTAREALRALARTVVAARPRHALEQTLKALRSRAFTSGEVEGVLGLLGDQAPRVAHALLEEAGDGPYVMAALNGAGTLRLGELAPRVASFVRSPDAGVRLAALVALARLGVVPSEVASEVTRALTSRVPEVRAAAAWAAGSLPPEQVGSLLERSLTDASPEVRERAAASLATLGPAGRRALARALAAPGSAVRETTWRALHD